MLSASTMASNANSVSTTSTSTTSTIVTSSTAANPRPPLQDKPAESLPYQCMECAREFADVPSLKAHRLEHLKERPFK